MMLRRIFDDENDLDIYYAEVQAKFAKELLSGDVTKVINLVNHILQDRVSQIMFEGLAKFGVTRQMVVFQYRYSRNKEYISAFNKRHNLKDISWNRVNYMHYVFNQISKQFPLEDEDFRDMIAELGYMEYLFSDKI